MFRLATQQPTEHCTWLDFLPARDLGAPRVPNAGPRRHHKYTVHPTNDDGRRTLLGRGALSPLSYVVAEMRDDIQAQELVRVDESRVAHLPMIDAQSRPSRQFDLDYDDVVAAILEQELLAVHLAKVAHRHVDAAFLQ